MDKMFKVAFFLEKLIRTKEKKKKKKKIYETSRNWANWVDNTHEPFRYVDVPDLIV